VARAQVLADRDDVTQSLFGDPTTGAPNMDATCAVVAAQGFCGNAVINYACPVSCSAATPASAYCMDNDAILVGQYGVGCTAATPAACSAQPLVSLTCPATCGSAPASCPCESWCNEWHCHEASCSGCAPSVCEPSNAACDSWCNKWTCIPSVAFFWDHCGGCTHCDPSTPGPAGGSRRHLEDKKEEETKVVQKEETKQLSTSGTFRLDGK